VPVRRQAAKGEWLRASKDRPTAMPTCVDAGSFAPVRGEGRRFGEATYEQKEDHQPDEEEDERQERRKAWDRHGIPTPRCQPVPPRWGDMLVGDRLTSRTVACGALIDN